MKKFSWLVALVLFGLVVLPTVPIQADDTQRLPNVPAIVTTQVHDADTNLATTDKSNYKFIPSVVSPSSYGVPGTSEVVSPARLSPAVWRGDLKKPILDTVDLQRTRKMISAAMHDVQRATAISTAGPTLLDVAMSRASDGNILGSVKENKYPEYSDFDADTEDDSEGDQGDG